MQLIYLWVLEFRNIRDQGFNFSSKFLISFDSRKGDLQIRDNPNYMPFFFGEAISDVTGIVGENAAGKTNLLELISYVMDGGNTRVALPFLLVFETTTGIQVQTYELKEPNVNRAVTFAKYPSQQKQLETVYFSNTFDGRRHDFGKTVHDLSSNGLLYGNSFRENIQTSLKREVQGQIHFLRGQVYRSMNAEGLDIKPAFVQFISPIWENIYSRAKSFDQLVGSTLNSDFNELSAFCKHFRSEFSRRTVEKPLLQYTAFLLLLDFLCNEMILEANGQRRPSEKKVLEKELKMLDLKSLAISSPMEIFERITGPIALFIDASYPHTFEKFKFLHELKNFEFPALPWGSAGTYSNRKYEFRAPMTEETQRFVSGYLNASTQLNLNYNIEWPGISAGQKAFLVMFSRFYEISGQVKADNLLLMIDEGDLYFHPRWQVEFLSQMLRTLPLLFPGKKLQLILTTHSPFLVSDLTKSHLIFLRKRGNKCQVVPAEEIEGETFGGNIGELYLHAFFLQGHLISDFAADKIRRLLEKIKSGKEQLSGADQALADQLGDRLIRYQIKQLRDDKN